MSLSIISYGGGVQSTALIVLAATGRIPKVNAAVFANVGHDSEDPATIQYIDNVITPWAAERGLPVISLDRTKRDGTTETLWGRLTKPESKFLGIPVRMGESGAPGNRSCTVDFKIKVIGKYLKQHGATEQNKATVYIGFSTDEFQRANRKRAMPYESPEYPLLDLGMDRTACEAVIYEAGLPVPGKSSCFFCPFHRKQTWREMRRDQPELFEKSVYLENLLNERRRADGKTPVYLTDAGRPLSEAIAEAGPTLFDSIEFNSGSCDEGACWT